MSTLWTFGDSFTFGHGCRPDGAIPEYYHNYKTESDDIWPELLGGMMNLSVKNFGKGGASNDFIIDSIIDNWDYFEQTDYVIVGITYHDRFDVPFDDRLISIFFDWNILADEKEVSLFENEEMKTILDFQYYFSNNELYKKRYLKRLNFLNKLLNEKGIKTFFWDVDFFQYSNRFEKIAEATDYKIEDYHFSFKGHKDFADMLYKKLISQPLI